MDFKALLDLYQNDRRVADIIETITHGEKPVVRLKGLAGSITAFIATAVFRNTSHNHVFIAEDKDAAAYLQNDLKTLLDNKEIFYFPDSFKRPGHFDQINNSNILLRTESINRFIQHETRSEILVTYPEAVFEKVVNRQVLNKNTIHISITEKLDIDFIIDVLLEYGFERTDFVYEPGQFSIRGGIVDIFSYGNELPYRIELFDDEVESIRTFDPATQLSNRKISRITIIPNIQTHFTTEEKVDLFEMLPKNTILWVKNAAFTGEVLNNLQEKAMITRETGALEMVEKHPFAGEDNQLPLTTASKFLQYLEDFPVVEFGTRFYFPGGKEIVFQTDPQPAFNKNFDLLIKDLRSHQEKQFTNFLFADQPKQIERFYQIFEDLKAEIEFYPVARSIHEGFIDHDLKTVVYTDHQIFDRYHKYHIHQAYSKSQAMSLKLLRDLEPGDYVVHIDHGVGKYSGLEKIEVAGKVQEAVRLIYQDNDLLYVNINSLHKISRYAGKDSKPPRVNKLGSDAWENLKRKTKRKVKDIADELIRLYAKRKAQPGFAFSPDTYLQNELEASFIYEDTPDQLKATNDTKEDMEKPHPMDRLICGDVGFGKTEVAIRAAFKAATDNKQVAILVPTTILAMQHFRTFSDRLKDFPVSVDYINRFKSTAQKKETLEKVKKGEIDILIGTHALLGKTVKFKDLGLLVIDEEQKFGVGAKEKLKNIKLNVDTLTLTATPIPRTLQFSLMGARDLTVINTPPPNRQPINTELHVFNDEVLREAIYYEFYRGGQIFFIHNRVKDIADITAMIANLCPEVSVGMAHGQMEGSKLEKEMMKFINHKYDVLISTNIIESGLDIPNANTIIINNAHWFGLSDLHQLRGRVGRSNKKAFCYLFSPPLSTLTGDARKRLASIEQFADLGSGFNIAMRDLDIRGAGNILGGEQSGFVAEIGFDTYHKILDEAIRELKETEYKELFSDQLKQQKEFIRDTTIDTDLEILFPDNYIRSVNERLSLYTELNNVKNEEELREFRHKLIDRFGKIPPQTEELFNAIRLQWLAIQLGFERIIFKNQKLSCYFVFNQSSPYYQSEVFSGILEYVQKNPGNCQLKQTHVLILSFQGVTTMDHANFLLNQIVERVV